MLVHPRIGQRVTLRYAKKFARLWPHHGRQGVVLAKGRGPGPRNHLIDLGGVPVVVPCGNLTAAK